MGERQLGGNGKEREHCNEWVDTVLEDPTLLGYWVRHESATILKSSAKQRSAPGLNSRQTRGFLQGSSCRRTARRTRRWSESTYHGLRLNPSAWSMMKSRQ